MMSFGAKKHRCGESPLETVGEISDKPLNHMQEKETKHCPHQILTESDVQIRIDANNNHVCKS